MLTRELIVKNLHKSFSQGEKKINVLNHVDINFEQGKNYAIVGASGRGKSTFLHLIAGLDIPDKGKIFFDGKDIFKFSKKEKDLFLNQYLGFVFQFHYLIKELSVLQNIMLPGLIKGESKSFCEKRAKDLLEKVKMYDFADEYPTKLSGGEQQRVAILRAVFNKPIFLLADEPTGNLDAKMAQRIISLLLSFQKEWKMGLILCSHDPQVYSKMDTVLNLQNGEIK